MVYLKIVMNMVRELTDYEKKEKTRLILTKDVICVVDWLCEPGYEEFYDLLGKIVMYKLHRKGFNSVFVGFGGEIEDVEKRKFIRQPDNYYEKFLDAFKTCVDNEVYTTVNTKVRNRNIKNCLVKSFEKVDLEVKSTGKRIKISGVEDFSVPPKDSLLSDIAMWSDANDYLIVTSEKVDPRIHPKHSNIIHVNVSDIPERYKRTFRGVAITPLTLKREKVLLDISDMIVERITDKVERVRKNICVE